MYSNRKKIMICSYEELKRTDSNALHAIVREDIEVEIDT